MQHCGLRPAETFALTREDISLKDKTIRINKAVRSSADELVTVGKTKTERSARLVPIPEALIPILNECLDWSGNDFILADYFGKLFEVGRVNDLILHVRKKKCPQIKFTMYQLRHMFSTNLHRAGIASPVIRDLMGHESAGMSLDYAVSYPEDRKKAVDMVNSEPKNTENKE